CPWAHRVHITLKELNLPYEEVIIDLERPREEWYLKINPRGLVPSIKFSGGVLSDEIIAESGVVAQFLADSYPSKFFPASHSCPTAALVRARIAFFTDTYISKVNPLMMQGLRAESEEERGQKAREIVDVVRKEVEPLLEGAGPYLEGSERLTMAEALTAPFLVRLYAYCNAGMFPKSLKSDLQALPHFSKWARATISQESVTYIWDEETVIANTKARIEKMKADAK
ncbi:hypothetical protein MMC06_004305, partial [Schaereria dolodes]|nr:hypothetical protein [Schaereria dolodes]